MNKVLLAAFIAAFFVSSAIAAEITPTRTHPKCNGWCLVWEGLGDADTTQEWSVVDGCYELFIDGDADGGDFQLQFGKTSGSLKDIDTDAMPDGLRYNSASTNAVNVTLGDGYADFYFTSAMGVNADADIWLSQSERCQ